MQDLFKRDSNFSTGHSTADKGGNSPSRWTSTDSEMQQSTLSRNLSFKAAIEANNYQTTKQLGFQFQDQDSSSTQSTGQSYPEVAGVGENKSYEQSMISVQSGCVSTHGKLEEDQSKSVLSTQDYIFPPPQVDYRQSFACFPYSFSDPSYRGLLAAYGPHGMVSPQSMGVVPTRVPLPLTIPHTETVFVNPKQFNAIMRRRERRAKLEAENKLSRTRKPYLHESRHRHALNRARGSGGRFLNTKKLQKSNAGASCISHHVSGSTELQQTMKMAASTNHELEILKEGNSTTTTTCSDITSLSYNSDGMFHQQDFRFSGYPSHIGQHMQGGGGSTSGGNQHIPRSSGKG